METADRKGIKETLADYIRWRGDLSFDEAPFNVLDNLVFCQLAYVDFGKVLKQMDTEGISLRKCNRIIEKENSYDLRTLYGGYKEFFKKVCTSRRFADVELRYYIDVFEEEKQVQFAAVEFMMPHRTSFVAFRGTDDSIVGWKEDFMLSFSRIPAQKLAEQYLQEVVKFGRKYYVGGHSKGGNLAVYACAWLTSRKFSQVIEIYDNDGPGFCPEIFDMEKLKAVEDKVFRILPEFCMIGKAYEYAFNNTVIVKSKNTAADQHDMMSWLLDGMNLQKTDKHDRLSIWLTDTIMQWANDATLEERKIFIDEFFAALAAGGAKTMQQVTGKGMIEVIKSMAAASKTSKRLVKNLAEIAFSGEKKS